MNGTDLNLFRILDAVYSERSVSRAATRLGLSQPRVSNALISLRALFGDRLFTKTAGGVAPTELMTLIAPRVRQAIGLVDDCFAQRFDFEPTSSSRVFRIHMTDSMEVIAVPRLRNRLAGLAPNVTLETAPLPIESITHALERGDIDFAVGAYGAMGNDITMEHLFDDVPVLLAHTASKLPDFPSREQLQEHEYIVVENLPYIEQLLADLELNRRVRIRTTFYLAIPTLLCASTLAVWLPRSIAHVFVGLGEYSLAVPPVQTGSTPINAFRHKRSALDPSLVWMWQQLLLTLR